MVEISSDRPHARPGLRPLQACARKICSKTQPFLLDSLPCLPRMAPQPRRKACNSR